MRRFGLLVVLAILLSVMGFVAATWVYFSGGRGTGWAIGVTFLPLCYIPVAILGFRARSAWLRVVAIPAALAGGLLSLGFVAAIACWLLVGATRVFGVPLERHAIGNGIFGLAFVAAIYGLLNAATIRVTRYKVALPNLSRAWEGRTAVLVSDIHLGNIHSVSFVRRVVRRIEALRPDVVFISGDMFDGAMVDIEACVEPWRSLPALAGVFFVTGNHDDYAGRGKITAALRRVGVRVLEDEAVVVDELQIVGVFDHTARSESEFRRILAAAPIDRNRASILLNHQPSHLSIPEEAGVSMQLSGHTHHGQMWPWSLLVRRIYGRFAYGLNRLARLQVITSSGVGTWGPPMRVGTRSEIVWIEFGAERPGGSAETLIR